MHHQESDTKDTASRAMPEWARLCAVITRLAGLTHDAGKNTTRFQTKLANAVNGSVQSANESGKDRWRHEWISAHVLTRLLSAYEQGGAGANGGGDPQAAIESFFPSSPDDDLYLLSRKTGHQAPIQSINDVLIGCVLTHHGLFQSPDHSRHAYASKWGHCRPELREQTKDQYQPTGELGPRIHAAIHETVEQLNTYSDEPYSVDGLRALTLLARAALIGADHEVSSWQYQGPAAGNNLFANTRRSPQQSPSGGSSRIRRRSTSPQGIGFNQPLDFHLMEVAEKAQSMINILFSIERDEALPGLSDDSRRRVASPSPLPDFEWQDTAASRLKHDRQGKDSGTLVFNMAGTGSGKTLANIKLVEAMTPDDTPCRFSIALNLRTLTLQTADALKEEPVSLGDDEVNCLIGDRLTQAFHDTPNTDEDDGAGNEGADLAIDMAYASDARAPQWLAQWCEQQKDSAQAQAFLMAPALVSTTDYLVKAGDPSVQGHHVRALLRLASSDLILDEVDGYDPKALISIARMVMVSALFGRNVICSSATLSEPVAACLGEAFATGHRMRHGLMGGESQSVTVAFVDNDLAPQVESLSPETMEIETRTDKGSPFSAGMFRDRTKALMLAVSTKPVKQRAFIQSLEQLVDGDESAVTVFSQGVGEAIQKLHRSHSWRHGPTGKAVSFGVVRVAHVRSALQVAHQLQSMAEGEGAVFYVTTYHSSDILGRRLLKERQFDRMFRRKSSQGDEPARDQEIDRVLNQVEAQNVVFIVVATPVEEVGRDHDFDWAVIEPSSVASIVQLAGRVNRHRRVPVDEANIAIMDQNIRSLQGEPRCFLYPGNGWTYKAVEQRRMTYLLADAPGWGYDSQHGEALPINASLRFGDHQRQCRFSVDDDSSYADEYSDGILVLKSHSSSQGNQYGLAWMTRDHYTEFPLRGNETQRAYCVTNPSEWDESLIPRDGSIATFVYGQNVPSTTDEVAITLNEHPLKTWAAPTVQHVHEALSQQSLIDSDNEYALFTFRVSVPGVVKNVNISFDPLLGGFRAPAWREPKLVW